VLGTEGECPPAADNRIDLADDVDEYGVPRPRVTFSYGDNQDAMRERIHSMGTATWDHPNLFVRDGSVGRVAGGPSVFVVDFAVRAAARYEHGVAGCGEPRGETAASCTAHCCRLATTRRTSAIPHRYSWGRHRMASAGESPSS
jgi:hypothetical protein